MRWAQGVGVGIDELVRAARLPLDRFETGEPLTTVETQQLWSALEGLTGDRYVGLHVGERLQIDQLGPVGPVFASALNLRRGLEAVVRTLEAFMPGAAPSPETSPDGLSLTYRSPPGASHHGAEAIIAGLLTLARTCTNAPVTPLAVVLNRPAPSDVREYVRVFGVRPTWGGDAARLLLAEQDLDRPLRGANPALSHLLVAHAADIVATANRTATAPHRELEEALLDATARGEGSLGGVATRLGVSARSVQRRLAAKGESFRELKARVLRERSLELLESDVPVREIAEKLGYANRASFERAFQRWTGETPATVRTRGRDLGGAIARSHDDG